MRKEEISDAEHILNKIKNNPILTDNELLEYELGMKRKLKSGLKISSKIIEKLIKISFYHSDYYLMKKCFEHLFGVNKGVFF